VKASLGSSLLVTSLASLALCALASADQGGGLPYRSKNSQRSPGSNPSPLSGTWDVEQVAVDGQDQIHWGYRPDDPQFLHRALVVEGNDLRFNGSDLRCTQDRWVPQAITWARLLAKGFRRPPVGGRKVTPTVEDFELKASPADSITAYQICREKTGRAAFPAGMWVALIRPDKAALAIDNSGIFVLTRRPPGAQPRASFECSKARSAAERTICGNYDLAAWDRSVALAWRQASERNARDELLTSQKEWLKKRDACGASAECLEEQMFARVGYLVQRTNW
jgi:uncharacterized protein YecT (DUF1311 family)